MVVGDRTKFVMLWQNLIGNSLKFRSPGRAPRVRIEAEERDGQWWMTVTDNGIGIPPNFADKIFVIFQRLHQRDAYEGTGIGLALCRKIVEYHRGKIWLDTEFEDGTRFVITLPVTAGPPRGGERERRPPERPWRPPAAPPDIRSGGSARRSLRRRSHRGPNAVWDHAVTMGRHV